jgi:hypothetical protein
MTSVVAERIMVVSSVTFWFCCYYVCMKCPLTPIMSYIHTQQSFKMQILVQIFKNIQLYCLRLEQLAVVRKRSALASDVIKGVSGVTN